MRATDSAATSARQDRDADWLGAVLVFMLSSSLLVIRIG